MNIVFITEIDTYSSDGAGLIRIKEFAKTMVFHSDNIVYITSLKHSNKKIELNKIFKDFEIYSVGKSKNDRRHFFIKRYFSFRSKQQELKYICDYFNKKKDNTIFIVYNFLDTFYDEFFTIKKIKNFGCNILVEKNELSLGIALNLPFPGGIRSIPFIFFKLLNIMNGFLTDEMVRYYDGRFVISSFLEEYTTRRSKTPYIKIPLLYNTINQLEGNTNLKIHNGILKLGYFGTITLKRDQILNIIKAIKILIEEYDFSKIKFSITGIGNKKSLKTLHQYIKKNSLAGIVTYFGVVDIEKLEEIQSEQDLLIALRNSSLQGKATFATKLANYMHLGKLVLTNNVSDNSKYIQNGVNGFLIEDTDPKTIARAIINIYNIKNEEKVKIRNNALNTALQYFHYANYCEDVQCFLNKLLHVNKPG